MADKTIEWQALAKAYIAKLEDIGWFKHYPKALKKHFVDAIKEYYKRRDPEYWEIFPVWLMFNHDLDYYIPQDGVAMTRDLAEYSRGVFQPEKVTAKKKTPSTLTVTLGGREYRHTHLEQNAEINWKLLEFLNEILEDVDAPLRFHALYDEHHGDMCILLAEPDVMAKAQELKLMSPLYSTRYAGHPA